MVFDPEDLPGSGGARPADVLSQRQFMEKAGQLTEVLAGHGVRPGGSVAVLLPMCLESVITTLACIRLEARRITLAVGDASHLLRDRIRGAGAPVVITGGSCRSGGRTDATKAGLDRALRECPGVRAVLVVPLLPRPLPWTPGRDHWWHEALASRALPPRPHPPRSYPPGGYAAGPYPGAMSSFPEPGLPKAAEGTGMPVPALTAAARLDFDDPLERRSADDADHGWGDRPSQDASAADLARFLEEKPPHHV